MDRQTVRKYNYWQWRTLIVLMIGYALFYFVRKNFSIVMPALEAELGLSKVQLGIFLTLNGVVYGISRFINGFFADRIRAKRIMMATGLAISAIVNVIIGLSPEMNFIFHFLDGNGKATLGLVYFIGSLWLVNGYMQGMGFPPCGSLIAHWIRPSELALKQSVWNSSHSIGAGLVAIVCGTLILGSFGYQAWQWCFFVPAILAFIGAFILIFALKDSPSDVGLPAPELMDDAVQVKNSYSESPEFSRLAYKALLKRMVFRNPIIWVLSVTNFCVYVIRFTILDWGATFLTQYKGLSIQTASTVVAASEIVGGIIGILLAGWATDRFFKSCAHRTCLVGLAGALICFFVFWRLPAGQNVLSIIFIILASFFIYMPQGLVGAACSNQATKRVAASANGLAGIFGYASTVVSGLLFGYIADRFGWDSVFGVALLCGVIGLVVIASIWRIPSDGYATANPILSEIQSGLNDSNL